MSYLIALVLTATATWLVLRFCLPLSVARVVALPRCVVVKTRLESVTMRSQAPYADLLLRLSGHGGLWEWAMEQRRSVRPPNWAQLAERLAVETEGAVVVNRPRFDAAAV